MFFSAKELCDYANRPDNTRGTRNEIIRIVYNNGRLRRARIGAPITLNEARRAMKKFRKKVVSRVLDSSDGIYIAKWLRPWDVVPKLREYQAPVGDFGVGVEIEMGFQSRQDASFFADKIKNWKYIAIDYEGGTYPIEATFAPLQYSKLSKNSQPCRYLQLLEAERGRVFNHVAAQSVGTHINVSLGGQGNMTGYTNEAVNFNTRLREINVALNSLTASQKHKYFNRLPYGYGYNHGRWIEWKLFNSQVDYKVLMRYIDITVELTRLVHSNNIAITSRTVQTALETGYNKRSTTKKKKAQTVSTSDSAVDTNFAVAA